ncbi:MAG: SIS domain-containing protein [Candidatus Aenigmarchaeota archaeon]|nr:SIS domain-containing protein [Candidatus Aenigmarchaeota archaeon]
MEFDFSDVKIWYLEACDFLKEAKIPDNLFEEFDEYVQKTTRKGGEICIVGSKRMEDVARIAAMFFRANKYRNAHCSSDAAYPIPYESNDLVIDLSASGETSYTVDRVKPALDVGAPIITLTTNESSTLAEYTKNNGLVIRIKGKPKGTEGSVYEKQLRGEYSPLTIEGTKAELSALNFFLDYFGSKNNGKSPTKFHDHFMDSIKGYAPNPGEFEEVYKVLSKPDEKNLRKDVIVGTGLSGEYGSMFATRYAHCVIPGWERHVFFYKDRGETALENGDGLIIFSVSGEGFPLDAAKIGKEQGANVVSFTSKGSPLEEISDAVIHVPPREEKEKPNGAVYHIQPDPAKCMPEYVGLLQGECLVCTVAKIEGITEREFNNTHSKIT